MRNLGALNPAFLKPSRFASVSAIILLAMALLSVPLACGVAPSTPLLDNPIALFICVILGVAPILAIGSAIFRWGWKAKYYGVSFLCFASVSFLAVVPCLVVVHYGTAPYWSKTALVLLYGVSHYLWCRKFTILYKSVFDDEELRSVLYEEELDAVYYIRRGDEFLIDKYYKFSQMPRDRYFALFVIVAFVMVPFMSVVSSFLGAPFVHIFLLVAALPISWMSIGFAVRGFLVFYFYPARIKGATGKDVYVDLGSKQRTLGKRARAGLA